MADQNSPLSHDEIATIEATLLPTLERHHLRLLAHCLASFKEMGSVSGEAGHLPSKTQQSAWISSQPLIGNDQDFSTVLLEQFEAAGQQLERLADQLQTKPLQLTLDDLINACIQEHRPIEEA